MAMPFAACYVARSALHLERGSRSASAPVHPTPYVENRALTRVRHDELWSYVPNRIFLQTVQHLVVVVWVVVKCNKLPRADVRREFERVSVRAVPPPHVAVVLLIRILSVVYK